MLVMPRRRNRFRNYLSIMAFVILAVLLSFKMIPDKRLASVITSLIFIGSSLGIVLRERKFPEYQKRPSYWGPMAFLVFCAIPVFAMRLSHWEIPFDEIEVMGVTGPWMHKASNQVFIVMMVCFFADAYLETRRQREEEQRLELDAIKNAKD